jgi:anti-anti-sigma regulatory factor
MAHRLSLYGEYDITRRFELRSLLATLPNDGPITIDLKDVAFGDSIFMRELVALRHRLPNAHITLAGADANMHRLLTIVGFDNLFHLAEA